MLLLKCHGICSKGAQEEDARQIFWQLIPALDYCHKMVRSRTLLVCFMPYFKLSNNALAESVAEH